MVPGSRAVTSGKGKEWKRLDLYPRNRRKYRDSKTDQGIQLEDLLR